MAPKIPGITVRILNDTGIIVPPLYERYPTIIGAGDPYKLISDTKVVRSAGSVDSIPHDTDINAIVSVGDLPGITKYVDGTDYALYSTDRISWLSGVGAKRPDLGDEYFISFTETRPASAYDPILYYDENLIFADHGSPTRLDSSINDVVVGASLALNSGCNGVIVLQLDLGYTPSLASQEAAFLAGVTKINQVTDYKLFLVPMSSGTLVTTTAMNMYFNHAVLASQPDRKQERTVIGSMPSLTTYAQFATMAQTYAHERMVIPAIPNGEVGVVGHTGTYDMRFYSAALAGKLCAVPIGQTIHDEIIPNITFTSNYTLDEQNYLVRRGVSPAKIRGDVCRNILAITTDTTNALTEDLGIQDIKDYVRKYWREGLWAAFKNARINANLLDQITLASRGILNKLIEDTIVSEFKNIAVAQDHTEPRKINITGKIKPCYSVGWMDITFTFVLSF